MVVPSKSKFTLLLGREWIHGVGIVPSLMHQRIAIWREADQSYFMAKVNHITK